MRNNRWRELAILSVLAGAAASCGGAPRANNDSVNPTDAAVGTSPGVTGNDSSNTPNGAPASQSGATTAFAILSPGPGDTLVEGQRYLIRWHAPTGMRIDLGAAMGGHDKGMLLMNASAERDSLWWTIPVGYVTGFGIQAANNVRLRLSNADSAEQWVETGPFTVRGAPEHAAPPSAPSPP